MNTVHKVIRQHKVSLAKTAVWEGEDLTEAQFQLQEDTEKHKEDFFMYTWKIQEVIKAK